MSVAACPACVAVPNDRIEQAVDTAHTLDLSVPSIHCAACISKIEKGLVKVVGIHGARVNLSLKRVRIHHDGQNNIEDTVLDQLTNLGFEADPLGHSRVCSNECDAIVRFGLVWGRRSYTGFLTLGICGDCVADSCIYRAAIFQKCMVSIKSTPIEYGCANQFGYSYGIRLIII